MTTRIQVRRGTAATWTSVNPVLTSGEWGYETDTGKVKIGDGTTTWTALTYFAGAVDWAAITGKPATFTPTIGATAGTAAEGNDTRITGAAQKASNLSDLASAATARTNLGLGGAATLNVGTTTGTVAAGDDTRITGAAGVAAALAIVFGG